MAGQVVGNGLWSMDQAAEVLGLSKHTLYKWVAAGAVPFVKLGRATRFEPDQLMRWVASRRHGGDTSASQ